MALTEKTDSPDFVHLNCTAQSLLVIALVTLTLLSFCIMKLA